MLKVRGYTIYSDLTGQHMMDISKNETRTHVIMGAIASGSSQMRKRHYLDTQNNWVSFGDEAGIERSVRNDSCSTSLSNDFSKLANNFASNQGKNSDPWKISV